MGLVLAALGLFFFFISLFTLIIIKFKEFCKGLPKFLFAYLTYLLFSNTFFYMTKIYLVCNYHDVSWGSRGKDRLKGSKIA